MISFGYVDFLGKNLSNIIPPLENSTTCITTVARQGPTSMTWAGADFISINTYFTQILSESDLLE